MKDYLKNLDLSEEQIASIEKGIASEIKNKFVPLKRFSEVNSEVKSLKEELENAKNVGNLNENDFQAKIQEYDSKINDYDSKIQGYETKMAEDMAHYNEEKTELENKIKTLTKDNAINLAIMEAGGKNLKAVRALIDTESLENENGEIIGLNEQISQLKNSCDYLFNTVPTFAPSKGNLKENLQKESLEDIIADRLGY